MVIKRECCGRYPRHEPCIFVIRNNQAIKLLHRYVCPECGAFTRWVPFELAMELWNNGSVSK